VDSRKKKWSQFSLVGEPETVGCRPVKIGKEGKIDTKKRGGEGEEKTYKSNSLLPGKLGKHV